MKILILSAFYEETKSFLAALHDPQPVIFSKRKCTHAKMHEHDIFLSYSGIGTTSAAATVTALCERLEPDCIIMCGTAGGLTPGQSTGDIVIAETVVDIDLYTLPRALTGTPYEPCLTDPHLATPLILEHKAPTVFLSLCAASGLPHVTTGKIATSNTFPAPEAAFKTIQEIKCNAIEMESTGVLNAVGYYNTPTIVVRAISNALDQEGHDLGTPETALSTCSDRLKDFLLDLLPRINALEPLLEEKKDRQITDLLAKFKLERHPEGGFYRRVFRSKDLVSASDDPKRFAETPTSGAFRPAISSIYYLIEKGTVSTWHRIKSDEMWHFYHGAPIEIYELTVDGALKITRVGNPAEYTETVPQHTVTRGNWFAVKTTGLLRIKQSFFCKISYPV